MEPPEYFLTSERLGFRCWEPGDSVIATALWGDSAVTRLFSKEPFSPEQIKERLTQELATERDYGVQYWPVFELESRRICRMLWIAPILSWKTKYMNSGSTCAPSSGARVMRPRLQERCLNTARKSCACLLYLPGTIQITAHPEEFSQIRLRRKGR